LDPISLPDRRAPVICTPLPFGDTDRHAAKQTSALDEYHMSQEQHTTWQTLASSASACPAIANFILDMDRRLDA